MKKTNLVFSGIMGAILLSAGAAEAKIAGFQIASKAYVDARETTINNNITNITKEIMGEDGNGGIAKDVENLQGALGDGIGTGLGEQTVSDALAGKADKVTGATKDAIAILDTNGQYVDSEIKISDLASAGDVTALSSKVGSGTIAVTTTGGEAITNIVDALNRVNTIAASAPNNENFEALTTAVGDASTGLVKDVNDLQEVIGDADSGLTKDVADLQTGVAAKVDKNTNNAEDAGKTWVLDNTGKGSYAKIGESSLDSALTTTIGKIATLETAVNGLTTGGDSVDSKIEDAIGNLGSYDDVAAALDDKADSSLLGDGITSESTVTDQLATKVSVPTDNTCDVESGYCVLTRDKAGNMYWIDITKPAIEESTGI